MKPNSSSPSDLAPCPDIPDEIIEKILSLNDSDRDRNSASLVRKDWYEAERWTRTSLFVRNRFPVCPQMVARRFPRITTVKLQGNPDKFSLFGWDGSNDLYPWLVMFAKVYPSLEELRVDTMTVGDDSLELLAESFPSLKALSLASCSGYSYEGIKTIRRHCNDGFITFTSDSDRFGSFFGSHDGFISYRPGNRIYYVLEGSLIIHGHYFISYRPVKRPDYHLLRSLRRHLKFRSQTRAQPSQSLFTAPPLDDVDELEAMQRFLLTPKSKQKDPKAEWQKAQFVEMRRRERKLGKPFQTRKQNSYKQAMVHGGRGRYQGR